MAANDYRGYLRNNADIEATQPRYHATHPSEPNYRPLVFGTLAVMGLLQVASSVAILLHLTGNLPEVELSKSPQPIIEFGVSKSDIVSATEEWTIVQEVQIEPIIADAHKAPRKGKQRCKNPEREVLPSAHLPIRVTAFKKEEKVAMIQWNHEQGHLRKMRYRDGRLLVDEPGLYYVYAKTCFRYYVLEPDTVPSVTAPPASDANVSQLIQYVCHEKHTSLPRTSVVLMKTGSTARWNIGPYNMYCAEQNRVVVLASGDGLFVNVSSAWMLDPEPQGTFFGAVKMGN
ncbi:hypothetical protein DPEC_G00048880 [Dallia pectoralis]|uniref:Uncharacterized protein n=1 Tax=Dallia pectoralis TaxID=75939 RepID=A0ACC2HAX5_DALPE|nr:hypothetical protein DPEC_G00048880 [Dallia pectoralis]